MSSERLAKELKTVACAAIDADAAALHGLSEDIWNNPELALEEEHAHNALTTFLNDRGFETARSYHMNTAFRASYGEGRPNVVFISEYDALPDIGHACGHNLIAEVGVAAGIGLKAAMGKAPRPLGKVTVLGTPAEERYGGKMDLIKAGAFADVDVAMMAHLFPDNDPIPIMLAEQTLVVTYTGRGSHAAGYPWEGINAVDAAVVCYQTIACLRQQIKPSWRINCIITEGGTKVNIIPERAVLEVSYRAPTDTELSTLRSKLLDCFNAAALGTGCQMEYNAEPMCSSVLHNKPMVQLYETNLAPMLPSNVPCRRSEVCGSTDMGNVAHVVPSLHPHFYIGGVEVNHTRGFTQDAGNAQAQAFTLTQAKALAMTAIDIMLDKELLKSINDSFQHDMKHSA